MGDWKSSVDKINELLKSKNLSAAAEELTTSLNKFPNQLNLLVLASDVYRASSNHEKSLEYAKLLVKHYPCQPNGYIRSAQDLIALGEKLEAQKIIQDGVNVIPENLYLLIVSREVFRRSGNREKCLDYSKNLITYHPSDWRGYGRAAQDLVSLERFEEAQAIINMGLEKIPNHVDLLTIATDVYRASGDREKSLKYSELLNTHHPENWNGYGGAVQDLVALKRFEEAQAIINMGLEKTPNHADLLTIATDVYRASGDPEKSLKYSELLITHHPDNWNGYGCAAQDLVALKRFEEAQAIINMGLEKTPNHADLLTIATDVYRASGDPEKSLKYSELLITHHPDNWNGYGCAAQDLVALKRFEEAQKQIQAGLEKLPNQINLNRLLAYTNRFNGITSDNISDIEKESFYLNETDLISYSFYPNYFKIIQSKRGATPESSKIDKSFVFVAGLGRSGTTALGQLLNQSSMIAMYTELCDPTRIDGYCRTDFSKELVTRALRSNPHKKVNFTILTKSLSAKLIGDKRPFFQFCAESSFDNLGIENTKCIFIDRSLVDICRSSHKRSENPNDSSWSLEKGVEHTILLYNASCRQIIHLHDSRPDIFSSFLFPTYEDVFSSPEKAIKLFEFCGVELSEDEAMRVDDFVRDSQKYIGKKIDPTNLLEMHIQKTISFLLDHDAHERFCTITGNHRDYLSCQS